MKRKHISLKEKLAAALYEMEWLRLQLRSQFYRDTSAVPIPSPTNIFIPPKPTTVFHLRNQKGSADEVIALYDWHHHVYHAHGGDDTWLNLTPLFRRDHREQTRKDLAAIAKGKRIQKKQERHLTAMEQKVMHRALRSAGVDSFEKRLRAQADETAAAAWNYLNTTWHEKEERIQRKQNEHQARMEAKHAGISDPTSDRAAKKRFASNRQGAARSRWRTARRG